MISRAEAVERASAYLREHGSSWFAYADGAQCNPSQGLWIVEPRDPEQQDGEQVTGGSVLVVPSTAPVYEISFIPGAHEELIGLQTPAEAAGLKRRRSLRRLGTGRAASCKAANDSRVGGFRRMPPPVQAPSSAVARNSAEREGRPRRDSATSSRSPKGARGPSSEARSARLISSKHCPTDCPSWLATAPASCLDGNVFKIRAISPLVSRV